jgi:5-methylcytosine-specific restriction endonuclease McrA
MNKRQARKSNNISYVDHQDLPFLLHYFNNSCAYCAKELTLEKGYPNSLEFDHYISLKESDDIHEDNYTVLEGLTYSNTVIACRSCNRSKGAKNPEVWIKNSFNNADEIIDRIEFYFSSTSFSFL